MSEFFGFVNLRHLSKNGYVRAIQSFFWIKDLNDSINLLFVHVVIECPLGEAAAAAFYFTASGLCSSSLCSILRGWEGESLPHVGLKNYTWVGNYKMAERAAEGEKGPL